MSYKAGTDQQGSTVWHALLVGDNSRDGVKHGIGNGICKFFLKLP